jgi:signal transduction histidine kinase
VADQLGTIVEGMRLQEQAERAAVLEERGRLARELHDSVTQLLYGINLFSRAGRDAYSQGKTEEGSQHLARLGETASQAIKEMRLLLYELRPQALEQQGLVGALQQRLDAVESRAGITARLVADANHLPAEVEQELYHIVQEALNNALKHSAATEVDVQIQAHSEGWLVEVTDDGAGFDPRSVSDSGGMGVSNIRDRAERLGATLTLISEPGKGTTVRVRQRSL